MSSLELTTLTSSQSAEDYARSLGAKVTLKKTHAEAARFPSTEVFNNFIKFLVSKDYRYRLAGSLSKEVSFRLPSASLSLRDLPEDSFELGEIREMSQQTSTTNTRLPASIPVYCLQDGSDFYFYQDPERKEFIDAVSVGKHLVATDWDTPGARLARAEFKRLCTQHGLEAIFN